MSDLNITVNDAPIQITAQNTPIEIDVQTSTQQQSINTSNFVTRSETGQFYPTSNPSGFIEATQAGGVQTINGLSGVLFLTGLGDITITSNGSIFQISGIISSGGSSTGIVDLSGYIKTGDCDLKYYSINNPSGFINSLSGLNNNPSGFLNTLSGLSISYVTGISGALSIQIINTNNNLLQTGSILNDLIVGLSGQFNQTGINLQNQINNINNGTGNFYLNSNPLGFITNSGFALYSQLTGTSGILAGQIVTVSNNLSITGQTLIGLIQAASAGVSALNGMSGILNLVGSGGVIITTGTQNIVISGDTSTFATAANITNTGQSLYNLLTGLSGQFNLTGNNLNSQINSLSGYSNSIFATISNLQATGQNEYNLITGLSGNLNSSGNNLQTQINTLTANLTNSGVNIESQISNLSGYTNNTFSTIFNLQTTGQNLYGDIAGLSGVLQSSGTNLQNQINTTNNNLAANSLNLSGNLQLTGQNLYNNIIGLSGTLQSTGVNLQNQINTTISNVSANAINLSGNLQTTGQNLYSYVISLSGKLQSTGTNLQTQINTLTNNLTNTGLIIGLLSGYTNNTFATITNLTSTGQQVWLTANSNSINLSGNLIATGQNLSAVKVTGSSIINNINLTGLGGTIILYSGNYVLISGAGGSIGGGVPGVNGITSAVNITGTGNSFVYVSSNQIYISGNSNDAINLSGNLALTGTNLYNIITGLSGQLTNVSSGLSILINTYSLPTGDSGIFVPFNVVFQTKPSVIGNLINNSGDPILAYQLSGINTTGFYINFTESITNTNYSFNYFATTGTGLINLGVGGAGNITITGNYALVTDLQTTGTNLQNQINNLGGGGAINSYLSSGARFYIISGQNPEGIVSAYSGSICTDWYSGIIYMKLTGIGVNGWS